MIVSVFWFLALMLVVLQTSVVHSLPAWLGQPDFVFIYCAYVAYNFAWIPAVFLVFSAGWAFDAVSGIIPGIYPLMNLLVLAGLKLLTNKIPIKESMYQIPLLGLSYFLVHMGLYFFCSFSAPDLLPEWGWSLILQKSFFAMLAAVPLFLVCGRLQMFLQKRVYLRKSPRRRRAKLF